VNLSLLVRRATAAALLLVATTAVAQAATVARNNAIAREAVEPSTDRIIVTLKPGYRGDATRAMSGDRARTLATTAGLALAPVRAMSGNAQVLALPRAMRNTDVQAVVDRIRRDPTVESAYIDAREHLMATPNDPFFNQQVYLSTPTSAAPRVSSANAPGAWDITHGTATAVVAIVDNGVRFDHPDLAGRLINGYDFVSADCNLGDPGCTAALQFTTANDGDGRDADASDPGDWIPSDKASNPYLSACDVENSTWHGTQVAGIVGAAGNNGLGVTGLNWNAALLIVRVSGALRRLSLRRDRRVALGRGPVRAEHADQHASGAHRHDQPRQRRSLLELGLCVGGQRDPWNRRDRRRRSRQRGTPTSFFPRTVPA